MSTCEVDHVEYLPYPTYLYEYIYTVIYYPSYLILSIAIQTDNRTPVRTIYYFPLLSSISPSVPAVSLPLSLYLLFSLYSFFLFANLVFGHFIYYLISSQ